MFVLNCILQISNMARAPWRHGARCGQFLLREMHMGKIFDHDELWVPRPTSTQPIITLYVLLRLSIIFGLAPLPYGKNHYFMT